MKFVLAVILFASSVSATITPDEKREALGRTQEVMSRLMRAEGRLITAHVTDEIGTRLIVQFAYAEELTGSRKCTYSYDRVLKRVLPDSWSCDF